MTDSPTRAREHGKGRRAERKREAISLRFLTEKSSPKRLQLGQFITPMNNSRGCVQGFVLFFFCAFEKPICKTASGFNGWKGRGGVTARCFSLKPPAAPL